MESHEWNGLVEDLGSSLLRYFLGQFPRARAGELVQEVFARCLEKYSLGEFNPASGTLRQYAFGIARFVKLEALRERRVNSDALSEWQFYGENAGDVLESFQEAQQVVRLRNAIRQLSLAEQEVISLMLTRELSLNEISEILHMPMGTVKSHLHRAKQNLKPLLLSTGEVETNV